MTPTVTKKRRADRLARRPDGSYDWQAIQDGVLVKIEKLTDKKRAKDAKRKSKLRAEQNQQNSDIAENSAILARERLSMNKSTNSLVDIAKSIISRGPDAQPGVTNRVLFEAMQKAADSLYADQPLTAEQRFARFCDTPEGTILRKAQGKAAPEPMGDDGEDEDEPVGGDSYKKLEKLASDLRSREPGLTQAAAFSKVYADPSNRRLVNASRSEHFAKLARAGTR